MINLTLRKRLTAAKGEFLLDIQTTIEDNSLVALYGDSGAGKTSLLRMLAGLVKPDGGHLTVNKETWFDAKKRISLAPQVRAIGVVFQDYALFPNMTVKENLSFALSRKQDKEIVDELLEIMELGNFQDRKPNSLSGGQKQRVAVARALVPRPKLLLLDEPLSALDYKMRSKLQDYLLQVHQHYQLTTVLVSHNRGEILKMADRVLVLADGKLMKEGTPSQIFAHQHLSGKFQFTGELVAMEQQGFLYILGVLIGNQVVNIIADEQEVGHLEIGNQVLVASKAFNPVVKKLE